MPAALSPPFRPLGARVWFRRAGRDGHKGWRPLDAPVDHCWPDVAAGQS